MFVGLVIQPYKCSTLSPLGLPLGFSLPFGFCYPLNGIKVLGVLFGSIFFSFSFLQVMLDEDVRHGEMFLKLRDV
jgi:hypothetical protein